MTNEMTAKEAVKILKGAIKQPNTEDGYIGQALTMGIKAIEEQQWIPVDEKSPEEFQSVLISTNYNKILICMYYEDNAFWKAYVEAWKPLPELYKGG